MELQFRTGNVVADAILNMKFHEAKSKMENIRIEVDNLIFPKDLKIESYDLAVILCNAPAPFSIFIFPEKEFSNFRKNIFPF